MIRKCLCAWLLLVVGSAVADPVEKYPSALRNKELHLENYWGEASVVAAKPVTKGAKP